MCIKNLFKGIREDAGAKGVNLSKFDAIFGTKPKDTGSDVGLGTRRMLGMNMKINSRNIARTADPAVQYAGRKLRI